MDGGWRDGGGGNIELVATAMFEDGRGMVVVEA
jgi:hypothetical protein